MGTISESIRFLLIKKGISQNQVAQMIDTSAQNLGQKLNRQVLKECDFKKICEALGVQPTIEFKDINTNSVIYRYDL